MRAILSAILIAGSLALPAHSQTCGGDFNRFVAGLKTEAMNMGHSQSSVDTFFRGVAPDPAVIRADRGQGIFQRPFTDFARTLISQNRMQNGQRNGERHDAIFRRAESEYGASRWILLAFWAFETDFGGFQGNFNTLNALVTLAHDCRRPELFRPQIFAALKLFERGDFDPRTTQGAWAGEIGMVQKLPADILANGIDGDGDGRVDLRASTADALLSGANLLRSFGWRAGQPWMHEISVPATLDWGLTGLRTELSVAEWQAMGVQPRHGSLPAGSTRASVVIPQGRNGPAFMIFPNFRTLFEWNQSFTYVLTTGYFATRLAGAPVFEPGNPEPGLNQDQMKELQRRLAARGFDVGGIDGILGAGTRAAVQDVQRQLGLPADAWPTVDLLNRL
jgi:lytic murein transglycosylase